MNNFISVIIVSGRDPVYLFRTISKLVKTKYPRENFEMIIVRDSKSKNYNFIAKFPRNNIKFKKIKFEGMSKSRNVGAKLISKKSKIVAFIDDDAIPQGDWIYEINNFFNKNSNINILAGKIIPIKNKTIASKYSELFSAHNIKKYNLPIGANMAFRSFLIKDENHDERFKRGYDDFDYVTRLILEGNKMGNSDKIVVKHKDPDSIIEVIKKRFQSSKYSILFFNKYKQNPFHLEDFLIIIFFLAVLSKDLIFRYSLLLFSLISFILVFHRETKNKNIKMYDKIRLFFLFIIIRAVRTSGKICGLIRWGFLKCRRS